MTHYERLGIPPDASGDVIRHAFRERALATHPDMRRGRPAEIRQACAEFAALREAYVTLIDPERRAEYDAELGEAEPVESPVVVPAAPRTRPPPHRIVPPMSVYEQPAEHGPGYADDVERQVWGEPLAVYLKRGLLEVLALLFMPGAFVWFLIRVRTRATQHPVDTDLHLVVYGGCLLAGFLVMSLAVWRRLRRIQAAGGLAQVWRLAGGWGAILWARVPELHDRQKNWRHSFARLYWRGGLLLHLVLAFCVLFVLTGPRDVALLAALGLAITLPIVVWFWWDFSEHF